MVRDMLESGERISKLREMGLDGQNMLHTGLRLVAEGVTSVDELAAHVELDR